MDTISDQFKMFKLLIEAPHIQSPLKSVGILRTQALLRTYNSAFEFSNAFLPLYGAPPSTLCLSLSIIITIQPIQDDIKIHGKIKKIMKGILNLHMLDKIKPNAQQGAYRYDGRLVSTYIQDEIEKARFVTRIMACFAYGMLALLVVFSMAQQLLQPCPVAPTIN